MRATLYRLGGHFGLGGCLRAAPSGPIETFGARCASGAAPAGLRPCSFRGRQRRNLKAIGFSRVGIGEALRIGRPRRGNAPRHESRPSLKRRLHLLALIVSGHRTQTILRADRCKTQENHTQRQRRDPSAAYRSNTAENRDCELRTADCEFGDWLFPNSQSAIRNSQSPVYQPHGQRSICNFL
jgi:hypothetical protein